MSDSDTRSIHSFIDRRSGVDNYLSENCCRGAPQEEGPPVRVCTPVRGKRTKVPA
jgi:hypothetical protein